MSSQQPRRFIEISCNHYRLLPTFRLNLTMTAWAVMGQGIYLEDPWTSLVETIALRILYPSGHSVKAKQECKKVSLLSYVLHLVGQSSSWCISTSQSYHILCVHTCLFHTVQFFSTFIKYLCNHTQFLPPNIIIIFNIPKISYTHRKILFILYTFALIQAFFFRISYDNSAVQHYFYHKFYIIIIIFIVHPNINYEYRVSTHTLK